MAAIAGGVVGGAVAILIIILIIYYWLKRQKRTEAFDGNFDPDMLDTERSGGNAARPGAMGTQFDLDGAEITPFTPYQTQAQPEKSYNPYAQMSQMGQQAGVQMAGGEGSGHRRSDVVSSSASNYPTTATGQSVTGLHGAEFRGPSPGPSLGTSGTLPSSKERESSNSGTRLQVSNSGNGEGRYSQGSGVLLQHRDAGPLQQQQQQPVPIEVPPSYNSIPHQEGQEP